MNPTSWKTKPGGTSLTFKGGTLLSKVYHIIDLFSEDIDLTCDAREFAADLLHQGNPILLHPVKRKRSAVRYAIACRKE
jgi:predicted nucleotidyltransferase component of viral defense system